MGADIAVGSTQRFGLPLGMGGPHAAFMSCRKKYIRELPGRIVGVSVDSRGRHAYRLALQTREQHIRREKAKSNICTAQVLPAVIAAFFAIFHGPRGLRAIAERVHFAAADLSDSLKEAGYSIEPDSYFDTIAVDAGSERDGIVRRLADAGINVRVHSKARIGISADELTSRDTLSRVCSAFGANYSAKPGRSRPAFSETLLRSSEFLNHPVFHMNRSESEVVRYMRRLADRDLALDRTMIPLGSCTMKLNSAAEMIPITWPEFGMIHPYAPSDPDRRLPRTIRRLVLEASRNYRIRRDLVSAQFGSSGRIRGIDDDKGVTIGPKEAGTEESASSRLRHTVRMPLRQAWRAWKSLKFVPRTTAK